MNSLIKSRFIARSGPGRAGISVLNDPVGNASKNNRIWTDIDGTQRPINQDGIITLTTTRQLTPVESGSKVVLNSTTSFTTTLPLKAAGLEFTFFVKAVGTSTGHVVVPHATDVTGSIVMYGKVSAVGAATAGTAGKGRIFTAGTAIIGDGLRCWCDGTSWYATPTGIVAEN